jgi:hypothetical protein
MLEDEMQIIVLNLLRLQVVLYGFKTRFLTLNDEHEFMCLNTRCSGKH